MQLECQKEAKENDSQGQIGYDEIVQASFIQS